MDLLAFWSYVHADDTLDSGRVVQLGRDIVAHYEGIVAESLDLFLDKDGLHWGDSWREQIDQALSNVAFFVPVLTPRYFKSAECRRELQFFVERAEKLRITELILPILYIDVPELHDDAPTDPLMHLAKRIQWTDWRDYRFQDRHSGGYRAAVDGLAQELVRRVRAVERVDLLPAIASAESTTGEEQAGIIDKLAALEEMMPRWTETLDSLRHEIEEIGSIMTRGTANIERSERQGKGFAARLMVARRVAEELGGPVEQIEKLGQAFAIQLAHIDEGVRVLLDHTAPQIIESGSQEDTAMLCDFLNSIRALSMSSKEGLTSIHGMVQASSQIEGISRDMRPPLRRLRTALTAMIQAQETTDAWMELVDRVDIDCSDPAAPNISL